MAAEVREIPVGAAPARLHVLILEDRPEDAELMVRALRKSGARPTWVRAEDCDGYIAALEEHPDVVLADYTLPQFNARVALRLLREHSTEVPFIVVTGTLSETEAAQILAEGADDYLFKDRLGRLGPAVEQAIRARRLRSEKLSAERSASDSARQWQATFDAISHPLFLLDCEKTLLRSNRAGELLLEQTLESAGGHPPCSHVRCELSEPEECPMHRMRRSLHRETSEIRAGGHWYSISVDPLFDDEQVLAGAVHLMIDITERKQLEVQLNQSQKLESLGRLAGGIAHDFNNLLTAIIANAELLAFRYGSDPHLRNRLQIILETGERASRISRQLLAFSRRQVLDPVRLYLNQMLREIRKMIPSLIGEDIRCEFRLGDDIAAVKADPSQLEQVILNLVVNARDAMPRGGELTLSTTLEELDEDYARRHPGVAPGRYVLLSVTDNGCGIPPEVQGKIFEPFFTTKGDKGTGLGLATVYGIVKQLGGHVAFYTEKNIGTEFKVYLPALEAEGAAREDGPAQVQAPLPRGTERILVVEDEPTLREVAAAVLSELGYQVTAAASAEEALALPLDAGPAPQLLIADVVLPGMRGDELAAVLRDRFPALRVILASGYSQERLLRETEEVPPTDFLHKPFSASLLARTVRQVLDR
ncbi:MAG: hybrid sensor histidine kinase/response regulator [Candidatus Methylomirabilia bacterium]